MPASDLGALVVKEVLNRASTDAADVNEVILGQVNHFNDSLGASYLNLLSF